MSLFKIMEKVNYIAIGDQEVEFVHSEDFSLWVNGKFIGKNPKSYHFKNQDRFQIESYGYVDIVEPSYYE